MRISGKPHETRMYVNYIVDLGYCNTTFQMVFAPNARQSYSVLRVLVEYNYSPFPSS